MKPNWPTKKLGEVCEINPRFKNDLDPSLKVGFLTMADVSEDAGIIRIQTRESSKVKKGFTSFANEDVLVAKITPCFENGKGAFVEGMPSGIGFGSTEFHVLRANKDFLLNKYLYYIVSDKKFRKRHAKFMTGSAGQQRISTNFLKKLEIPLLPLQIQKQIVERLDKIAEAQKMNDKQIELAEELFQSLLSRELDPKGKNWNLVKVGDVVRNIEYGLSVSVQNRLNERGIPILTMAEIEDDGQINYQKARKISVNEDEFKKFKINNGELLFNWRNEKALIGKTGLFESKQDFVFASFLLRIITNEKILPDFLWYWLNYLRTKKSYFRHAHLAGNQASHNANSLRNKIFCPLISLKVQKQIVAKLSAAQGYKKGLVEQKAKLKELFDSVLQRSMNGEI